MWYFIGYYAISGLVWGLATQAIIENKGYKENWFWWGYFFEFIAVLVAVSRPNNNIKSEYITTTSEQIRKSEAIKNGAWTCSKCGKFNYGYVTTCTCGMKKSENDKPVKVTIVEPEKQTDNLDQIKKLKELLDIGAITQEEFDKKKTELLK